ncbi:MAG: DUF177 domain-containing protein [Candidatus Protistobacter heckmanni]|nr:DUF177 domain-containing protein [Candidatus Protistobacter heckmanni]
MDIFAFVQKKPAEQVLEGHFALAELPRMIAEKAPGAPDEGGFQWRLSAADPAETKPYAAEMPEVKHFLEVRAEGEVWLECQRCLKPYKQRLEAGTVFALAASEEEADALPILEEGADVVVGSKDFDLAELVEEELLLAMPGAPKHEFGDSECVRSGSRKVHRQQKQDNGAEAGGKPHPFAALAAIKQGKTSK